jgi:aminopeptidase-like protein
VGKFGALMGDTHIGEEMFEWATELFPLCRSITGAGVRETLAYLRERVLPCLRIVEVASGTAAFDWHVPDEWHIRDAYIQDASGRRIADYRVSNLQVVGYSEPVDKEVDLATLQKHLHSLPSQPDAVPYVTSYYSRTWGFCITDRIRRQLAPGRYHVVIDTTLAPGSLTYAELILPGREEREVLLSTYVCHPSMANDNLSGVVVTAALARDMASQSNRRYTYRIVFIPETIGALVYLSHHFEDMKRNTIAGFVVTCVGDERAWSFMPSRMGGTLADSVALHFLRHYAPSFTHYDFLDRGSDERQYCSPGVDLPVVSIMRSAYRGYPEYHTSLDDLSLITPQGLADSLEMLKRNLTALERNRRYRLTCYGEPQLGRRGMYPLLGSKECAPAGRTVRNILAYCDGEHDLIQLAERVGLPADSLYRWIEELASAGLLEEAP